jgi:hypothetical protein
MPRPDHIDEGDPLTVSDLPEPWQLYPMPPEQIRAIERHIASQADLAVERERERLTRLLSEAAAGRREYAVNAPDDSALVLEDEARGLETVARLIGGDMSAMTAWLPSWRWTNEMVEEIR